MFHRQRRQRSKDCPGTSANASGVRSRLSATIPDPRIRKKLDCELIGGEPRRLRIENWRVVYAVIETDVRLVAIVAVRRRPPYDYKDLPELFEDV